MKARRKALFIALMFISLFIQPVFSINDYGEDEDYLGQVVDDYLNEDYVQAKNHVIWNETLGCMELNYTEVSIVADENFSTYTEVDVEGRAVVTDSRITFTHLDRDDTVYVYKDFGENYFVGDFSMNVTHRNTAAFATAWAGGWALWNKVDDTYGCYSTGETGIQVFMYRSGSIMWYLRQWTGGVATSDSTPQIGYSIKYLTIERVGNRISCMLYHDEARTNLWDNLTVYQTPTSYRYLYGLQSLDTGNGDYFTGYVEDLNIGAGSGYENGEYYTTEMLDGNISLALLYNATIPENTAITIEFSNDNATWVDHNNVAGSDTLTAGYESLDLRDLNTTSLYMRCNMTANYDTPRMYQLRLVTITNVTLENGNGETVYVYRPEGWVLTIMIAAIGGTLIILGTRRRRG